MTLRPTALLILAVPFIAVACSLAADDADEAYLTGFCTASNAYSDAIADAGTTDAISEATAQYRDAIGALQAPDDLEDFQDEFLAYLDALARDPAADPGDLPDMPSGPARRLDQLAPTISECRNTDYFGESG
jgi:hypothetical protein